MNKYVLHDEATELSDRHSGYALARMVLSLREENERLYSKLEEAHPVVSQGRSTTACDDQFTTGEE